LAEEDNVFTLFEASQTTANHTASPAQHGVLGKSLAAIDKLSQIPVGLIPAPGFDGEFSNTQQVGFCSPGIENFSQ